MARLIPITDPDDDRIAAYRDIREKDLVGHGGRFVAEGEVVLRVLLTRSRFRPESVLVLDSRVEAVADALAGLGDDIPAYTASRDVMDGIVGFPIHRGILAIGRRGGSSADTVLAALADPPRLRLVAMIGVSNHDNVGGIFRNAAAFDADAVLFDRSTCDPLYRKAIRVSVGASLMVPFVRIDDPQGLLDRIERLGIEPWAFSPDGMTEIGDCVFGPRAALVFGAEGPGLPQDVLTRCRTVRIDMAPGFDSLNVAVSSGIALHHLARSGGG